MLKAFDKKLISTYGNFQEKFEKNLKNKKFKYCISLNSGTSALQLALNVEGIKRMILYYLVIHLPQLLTVLYIMEQNLGF